MGTFYEILLLNSINTVKKAATSTDSRGNNKIRKEKHKIEISFS